MLPNTIIRHGMCYVRAAQQITFKLHAGADYTTKLPQEFEADGPLFKSRAAAEAVAAKFPAMVKIKVYPVSGWDGQDRELPPGTHNIGFQVRFTSDKTQGARNEAGEKRLAKFLQVLQANGWATIWHTDAGGWLYKTRADFDRGLKKLMGR